MIYDENFAFYLDSIKNVKCFSKKEEVELFQKYNNGENVIEKIFEGNLFLVIKIAKDFEKYLINTNLTTMDLIQSGNLGLLKAIEEYNLFLNTSFSTYATFWIKQYIQREINNNGYMVRLPIYLLKEYKKYCIAYEKLLKDFKRKPSNEELSKESGISIKNIINIQKYSRMKTIDSLDELVYESDLDIIEDVDNSDNEIELKVYQDETHDILLKVLNEVKLTDIQYKVINLIYGLDGNKPKTAKEIANELGCCYQYISNVLKNSLNKIRKSKEVYKLINYRDNPLFSLDCLENLKNNKKFRKV